MWRRPCVGRLGSDPVEMDLFDVDSNGRIQVALLPHVCVVMILRHAVLILMYVCMYVRYVRRKLCTSRCATLPCCRMCRKRGSR